MSYCKLQCCKLQAVLPLAALLLFECGGDDLTEIGPTGFAFRLRLGAGQIEAVNRLGKNLRTIDGLEIAGDATATQTERGSITIERNCFKLHLLDAVPVEDAILGTTMAESTRAGAGRRSAYGRGSAHCRRGCWRGW